MRFTLYLFALLGITQLHAQSFSDSTLMDQGVQYPRSELVSCDKKGGDILSSKYIS